MGHVWGLLQLETMDVYHAGHFSGRVVVFVYQAGLKTGLSVDNMAWDFEKEGAAAALRQPQGFIEFRLLFRISDSLAVDKRVIGALDLCPVLVAVKRNSSTHT